MNSNLPKLLATPENGVRQTDRKQDVVRHVLFVIVSLAAAGAANAASLTGAGYTEDFNSMGTTGTAPPVDWSVYVGPSGTSNTTWTSSINGTDVAAMVLASGSLTASSAPTANNNSGYNAAISASNTADRVLATAPTTVSGNALQLLLTNNTGAALTGINVSFDTVRFTSVSSANELPGYQLFYSLDGLNWNNVASLNPTIVTVPNSVGVTTSTGSFAFASAVASGANFYLRWVDDNAQQTSPDQIIGLNNVSVSAVPLPAAAWLLISGLGGLGLLRRKRI